MEDKPYYFGLEGKRAFVTGASSGLGAYFAETLAAHGANVLLAGRRSDALEQVARRIGERGGNASTLVLDVTQAESREALSSALGDVDELCHKPGLAAGRSNESHCDWREVRRTLRLSLILHLSNSQDTYYGS